EPMPSEEAGRGRLGAGISPERVAPRQGEGTVVHDLAQFLASPGEASRRFVLEDITFGSESALPTPESVATINGIAAVLKAHPSAQISLEGHTDSTGSPDAAQQLSLDRADAVKRALIERGVAPDRITTSGAGSERPIASNDTPE